MTRPRAPEDGLPRQQATVTPDPELAGATLYALPVRWPQSTNWTLVIRCEADGSGKIWIERAR
jgi:hypothetical protein